ncbi:hypothetical protein JC221_071 [Yersinia phage JC221]|nr:hypothetical protein JC221_071 [Yersinia phage JC221]
MTDLTDVKVGDTLFDSGVRTYGRNKQRTRVLHVIKVARQYLYASEDQDVTDIKDFRVEKIDRKEGRSVGLNGWGGMTVYRSEADYNEAVYRVELCGKIKAEFGREHALRVPEITTAELRGIAKTLGVEF